MSRVSSWSSLYHKNKRCHYVHVSSSTYAKVNVLIQMISNEQRAIQQADTMNRVGEILTSIVIIVDDNLKCTDPILPFVIACNLHVVMDTRQPTSLNPHIIDHDPIGGLPVDVKGHFHQDDIHPSR